MKLVMLAGPASAGKTALARQVLKNSKYKCAYLKIDVTKAPEVEEIGKEFRIPTKVVYSGDLCPDHASVLVMGDAVGWAKAKGCDLLIVESAGLCLRCTPFLSQGVGVVVVSAVSGIHAPDKMQVMLAQADVAVVSHIDMVSQAEREVFIQRIVSKHKRLQVIESNLIHGTFLNYLYDIIEKSEHIEPSTLKLKGLPPLGTCTICVGKREVGWENHSGILRKLEGGIFFRGE